MQEWFVRVDPLGAYLGPYATREQAQAFIDESPPTRLSLSVVDGGATEEAAIVSQMHRRVTVEA